MSLAVCGIPGSCSGTVREGPVIIIDGLSVAGACTCGGNSISIGKGWFINKAMGSIKTDKIIFFILCFPPEFGYCISKGS